jgi:hypothetical protein
MNSKFKIAGLLIIASLSAAYFQNVSGLDVNIIGREILFLAPLQMLAFIYVAYYYYCQKQASK